MSGELRVPLVVGTVLIAAGLGGLVVWAAINERGAGIACLSGLVAKGPRCCGEGQRILGDTCVEAPTGCPEQLSRLTRPSEEGCAAPEARVAIRGGSLTMGPSDWESQGVIEARVVRVEPFLMDAYEVTIERWNACVRRGACEGRVDDEPGRPVTSVTPLGAGEFCRQAGGSLPTSDQWLFAAMGEGSRRFAWGHTGLVCRRAVYGRIKGPCGFGGRGPELTGITPGGASPEGVQDLIGNVAEWAREPDGTYYARGGSYRSQGAAELKSWSFERVPEGPRGQREPHVGFRCVYPATR